MKALPPEVWVFVDTDGTPCLVQLSEPRRDDFQHFNERAARYRLVPETETRRRAMPDQGGSADRRSTE